MDSRPNCSKRWKAGTGWGSAPPPISGFQEGPGIKAWQKHLWAWQRHARLGKADVEGGRSSMKTNQNWKYLILTRLP